MEANKTFITECEDKLLLFIDNFSNETDVDFQWLTGLNAHQFITSRLSDLHKFETYEINFLDNAKGIEVFYCYYKHDKEKKQKETVAQLVDLVSRHTLSIELLAGIANQPKYRYKLNQFLQDLENNGFGFPNLTIHSSHTYEDLPIAKHLVKLFEIAPLDDEQLCILGNFRIIPKGLQLPSEFSDWIGGEDTALTELEKTKWISFSKNGYLMYNIVWEAVKLQLTNIPYEYAKKMIDTVMSGGYFNDKEEHLLSTKKLQIAEGYAEYFSDRDTEEWGNFLNELGLKFHAKGEYDKAREYCIGYLRKSSW